MRRPCCACWRRTKTLRWRGETRADWSLASTPQPLSFPRSPRCSASASHLRASFWHDGRPGRGYAHHGAHNAARRLDHGLRLYRLVEPAARQPVVHHATAFRTAVHAASSGRHGGVLGDASVRGADLPRPHRVADRAEGGRDGAHLPGAKYSNGQREAPWNVQAGRPIPCPILCPYTSLLCTHAYLL